jgi:hypothetical protein
MDGEFIKDFAAFLVGILTAVIFYLTCLILFDEGDEENLRDYLRDHFDGDTETP